MLTELIKDHMVNPRNRGEMKSPDGVGEAVGPICGDVMTIYIKTAQGCIQDVTFTTYGCWAAIAIASLLTEMAKGQKLEEARKIDGRQLAKEVAGLPQDKLACSELAAVALQKAILACLSRT